MKYSILLNRNENLKEIIAKEQARFIKSLFEIAEIPIEWNLDAELTISERLAVKNKLFGYKIQIVDDMDGGVKIYASSELIGEWKKCSYKIREDNSQLDPNSKLYLELSIDFWSAFEDNNG